MVCLFAYHAKAYGDTFEYDGLTVTTDGVEGTDYQKEDRAIRILTDKDFTFSATSTLVKIVVNEGVQNAHFTLSGYNCDRGYEWIGGPIIIGKNTSVTITLAEGTTNTIKGSYETETMLIDDGASVTINGTGTLTANTSREVSAGHGAAIQLNKTAKLTIDNGTINANSEACNTGEGAAIGGPQYGDVENCGTLVINGGTVTLTANNAAAFGGGTGCCYSTVYNPVGRPGGTLIVNGGKLIANGRIGGGTSVNGETYEGGAGGSITINGGEVETTMDLGSAPNATSAGSIDLVGGTLSTPSMTMENGTVTFTKSTTLKDVLTTTLPVYVNANVVLNVSGNVCIGVEKSNITLAEGARFNDLNEIVVNDEGVYELYTLNHLKWFAGLVNGTLDDGTEQNSKANAKLMADIDLGNEAWTPIGDFSSSGTGITVSYEGTFDGNYHTISNLYITSGKRRGFIGWAKNASIKNLGIVNAKIDGDGASFAGTVVGFTNSATIQGCWTSGALKLPTDDVAKTSGIANIDDDASVKNCHTSYSVVAKSLLDNNDHTTNCTANIATDAYKTGELAYLLNSKKEDSETGWGQEIGKDEHPVALTETNKVYKSVDAKEESTFTMSGGDTGFNRAKSLCYPANVSLPEHVKAFTVVGIDNKDDSYEGAAYMEELGSSIVPANTPVFLIYGGYETVTITLPAISGYYDNNETSIISQDGNLLKGTYNGLSYDNSRYAWRTEGTSGFYRGIGTSAYECYIEKSNDMTCDIYCPFTIIPIEETEYAVLSEKDKTCYVSRMFYYGIGTSDLTVNIPETANINGTEYTVAQFGSGDSNVDKLRFSNCTYGSSPNLYINIPETVKSISKRAAYFGNFGYMSSTNTYLQFSTETAPSFIGDCGSAYGRAQIVVPYAAEDGYNEAWGNGYIVVSSRKTEVDIANGYIEVKGNTYTQYTSYTAADEVEYKAIDGTLVIKGTTDKYDIYLEGASEGEPLRIAINGLSIDNQNASGIPSIYVTSDLSLIVQGENTLSNAEDIPNIELVDGVSFAINSLSTGTLNLVNGISGDNVAVSAKVYDGSADFTTLNVTKSTTLDADRNQLAFTNYDFVTGPDNLVANGKCQKFVLNDGVDIYTPSAFTVSEVTYKRSFNDNGFNALYLPFSVNVDDFDDCEFYVINMFHQSDTDDDGILDNISLEVERIPDGSTLNANHPYLFKYTGTDLDSDHEFNLADVNVLPTESTAYKCSSMSYDYVFTGYYNSLEASDEYYTIGVDSETGKTALVHPSGDDTPAMRWVLRMTPREAQYGTAAQSNVRTISIFDGNEQTTGIGAAGADRDRTNAAYYGIDGIRLAKPAKGITLIQQNGRVTKVFTK